MSHTSTNVHTSTKKSVSKKITNSALSAVLACGLCMPTTFAWADETDAAGTENAPQEVTVDTSAGVPADSEIADQGDIELASNEAVPSAEDNAELQATVSSERVLLGSSNDGVYASVQGDENELYLYLEPLNGSDGIIYSNWSSWEEYVASDYYTKIIAANPNITAIKVADGANISLSGNCSCLFGGMSKLTDISDLARVDTSNMTQAAEMFSCNSSLSDLSPIANWDVSNVSMMYTMFREDTSLTSISALSDWNTAALTDISAMFYGDTALTDISVLADWDTSNVNEIYNLLSGCTSLTDISAMSSIDVSNVDNLTSVFGGCTSLTDLSPIANWNTSKNIQLTTTFAGCTSLSDLSPIANWNTSNVQSLYGTFAGCTSLSDLSPIANWNTSNVVLMHQTFMGCTSLYALDGLDNWNTDNTQYMTHMFVGCTALKDTTATQNWNTQNVLDMTAMFANDTALYNIDLNVFDNAAVQTNNFYGIDTSNVRHFKLTDDKEATTAILAENNICDIENMQGENLVYLLRDINDNNNQTTYASWSELLNNWDSVSGQWIDVVEAVNTYEVSFYAGDPLIAAQLAEYSVNEGECLSEDSMSEVNSLLSARAGYTFDGWYYEDATGAEQAFTTSIPISSDIKVYAKWNAITSGTTDITGTVTLVDPASGAVVDISIRGIDTFGDYTLLEGVTVAFDDEGNIVATLPDDKNFKNLVIGIKDNSTSEPVVDKYVVVSGNAGTGEGTTDESGNANIKLLPDSATIKYSVYGGYIYTPDEAIVGKDYTLTYEPYAGWVLKSITVDGVQLEDLTDYQTSYTFYAVDADHEFSVEFAPAEDMVVDDETNTTTTDEVSAAQDSTTDETGDSGDTSDTSSDSGSSDIAKTSDENPIYMLLMAAGAAICALVATLRARKFLERRQTCISII